MTRVHDFEGGNEHREHRPAAANGTKRSRGMRQAIPQTAPKDPLSFFIEPQWATEALPKLPFFTPIRRVIDPCCGSGNIVKACRAHGMVAFGSDIVDRGVPEQVEVRDFLKTKRMPAGFDGLVFNAPYGRALLARRFIEHARSLKPKIIAAFVENRFLASQGRYSFFMREHRPTCIAFLSDRPSCPPGDMFLAGEIEDEGGKQDYCWLIYCAWLEGQPHPPVWLRRPA